MVRTGPSAADQRLIQLAADRGVDVSARQLERWRARPYPLLPPNPRVFPGRPVGGSSSTADDGLVGLIVWLGQNSRRGGDPFHLALRAFGVGLPVPEATVREAFARPVVRFAAKVVGRLGPLPEGGDLQDWVGDRADAIAREGVGRSSGVSRRVRAIDKELQQLPALAEGWSKVEGMDPGRKSSEPLDSTGRIFYAVAAAVGGIGEIDPDAIARMSRSQVGRGVPQWGAHLMENDPADVQSAFQSSPAHQLPGLPVDSGMNWILTIARESPLDRLRLGWDAAGEMGVWARGLCAQVEEELAAGQPGDRCVEWILGQIFGFGRLYLIQGLADPDPGPAQQAHTALTLVATFDGLNRTLASAGPEQLQLLRQITPPFLVGLFALPRLLEPIPDEAAGAPDGEGS
ncbi:hypothetical protein EDD39_1125 [Kitasatospora cineracea]|uniref:Uncharacterized protein n=2 Tax=Kitasatospora cineracea TaxID=88074 RepID=A0A8G1UFK0_9ACTN|nr:hypothetical protein EDD39_1125 [Kitasatospora cineracea]